MASVVHLARSTNTHFAVASGAPHPPLPTNLRPHAQHGADVIELHPSPPARTGPGVPVDRGAFPTAHSPADGPMTMAASREDDRTAERISGIARSVAQGALEVLSGSRPLQQMAKWLDPDNFERLQLRANLVRCITAPPAALGGSGEPRTAPRQVVVKSARICAVRPGVYEASVVAFDQKRVRAVALRIEQRRGAWRVTALEIG